MKNAIRFVIPAMLITAFALGVYSQQPSDTDKREYAAYRDCIANASELHCHMEPLDFVRYYELKHQLEEEQ